MEIVLTVRFESRLWSRSLGEPLRTLSKAFFLRGDGSNPMSGVPDGTRPMMSLYFISKCVFTYQQCWISAMPLSNPALIESPGWAGVEQ